MKQFITDEVMTAIKEGNFDPQSEKEIHNRAVLADEQLVQVHEAFENLTDQMHQLILEMHEITARNLKYEFKYDLDELNQKLIDFSEKTKDFIVTELDMIDKITNEYRMKVSYIIALNSADSKAAEEDAHKVIEEDPSLLKWDGVFEALKEMEDLPYLSKNLLEEKIADPERVASALLGYRLIDSHLIQYDKDWIVTDGERVYECLVTLEKI